MFLPIGFEGTNVRRVPAVTLAIGAACSALFVATLPAVRQLSEPAGLGPPMTELVAFWGAHPYLELSTELLQRLPALEPLSKAHRKKAEDAGLLPPSEGILELEQERLGEYEAPVLELLRRMDRSNAVRRWGLVPVRGVNQPGWLTHAFLHLGWPHLLGNLFYLLLLGAILLEDAWGRSIFAAFFCTAAVAAAAVHALFSPGSQIVMVGASGAISGCVGAAVYRFARRRIRVVNLLSAWRGLSKPGSTFLVPAWLWGAAWFAIEITDLVRYGPTAAGVAFAAHVGGFGFGLVFAIAMRGLAVERMIDAPQEHTAGDEELDEALRLARTYADMGRLAEAQQAVASAVAPLMTKARLGPLWTNAAQLIALHAAGGVSHALALTVAQSFEKARHGDTWRSALSLYLAVGAVPGALGQKALLRSVQLRCERGDSLEAAAEDLHRLLADATLAEPVRVKAIAAQSTLGSRRGAAGRV